MVEPPVAVWFILGIFKKNSGKRHIVQVEALEISILSLKPHIGSSLRLVQLISAMFSPAQTSSAVINQSCASSGLIHFSALRSLRKAYGYCAHRTPVLTAVHPRETIPALPAQAHHSTVTAI